MVAGVKEFIDRATGIFQMPASTVQGFNKFMESADKFSRTLDDLHAMRSYLNQIRICFIVLAVFIPLAILVHALIMRIRIKKREETDDEDDRAVKRRNESTSSVRSRGKGRKRLNNFDLANGNETKKNTGKDLWVDKEDSDHLVRSTPNVMYPRQV